jgi:hypothetical protein
MLQDWINALKSDQSILAGLLGAAGKNGMDAARRDNIKAARERIKEAKRQIAAQKKQRK